MKAYWKLFVLVGIALLISTAAIAVPIFNFNETTGVMTIDTQGLTIESFLVPGPSTGGDPTNPDNVAPLFQGPSATGGGADGLQSMDWWTFYLNGKMQSLDQDSFAPPYSGVNSNNLGVMVYATWPLGTQVSDFNQAGTGRVLFYGTGYRER